MKDITITILSTIVSFIALFVMIWAAYNHITLLVFIMFSICFVLIDIGLLTVFLWV